MHSNAANGSRSFPPTGVFCVEPTGATNRLAKSGFFFRNGLAWLFSALCYTSYTAPADGTHIAHEVQN